jgi:YegS/Rv2252/BmrU family lipid kinase
LHGLPGWLGGADRVAARCSFALDNPLTRTVGLVRMASRRALLLINRNSRHGAVGAELAVPVLTEAGFSLDRENPGDREHTDRLIRARRDRIDLVIVGGGDGTVNAAAQAVIDTGLPLGILPLGTGNDLARTIGLPLDPAEAAAVIAGGVTQPIDVGLANAYPFFNAATIGLSNAAAQRLTGEVKQRWGPLGYPITLIDAWQASHPFTIHLDADGQRADRRSIQLVVGNGRHHGAGMTVSASARIDDHQLDIYSLDPQPWWAMLRHLPDLRRGADHVSDGIWRTRCRKLRVETDRSMRVRTDGEPTTATPVTFEIVPGAVMVFVPA